MGAVLSQMRKLKPKGGKLFTKATELVSKCGPEIQTQVGLAPGTLL